MHFRQCDARLNATGGRKTASAYDAIGAAQVAKASFSGMRLLHRLDGRVRDLADGPAARARAARSSKSTRASICAGPASAEPSCGSRTELDRALAALGSRPARLRFEPNDHQTDALVTAAGMRALAAAEPRAFAPEGLTPELARTEGWTFGIL